LQPSKFYEDLRKREDIMSDSIKAPSSDIKTSKHIVVFTHTEILAESGLPAPRGKNGLRMAN
jgi:hypothetical protein